MIKVRDTKLSNKGVKQKILKRSELSKDDVPVDISIYIFRKLKNMLETKINKLVLNIL
ncbi:hypothetical protein JOD17_003342 [Geomicrobium sediminis]|uniref:Uncharacterized protein n=1 Tax=Geomicrobium sediminis TaxID=1347788 RepID=A0ABS2PGT8_9BACL|nr:hypothetical protein [Geomicrobium sediminis]